VRARFRQLGTAPATTSSNNGEGPKLGLGWGDSGPYLAANKKQISGPYASKFSPKAPKSGPLAWSPGGCSSPPKLILIFK